jgi:hypothetical protein
MGSLGDNLLKLTEFPFSYSLIGLLALIFGQGLNPEEGSLDNLGPLLILMGFVATTLSITDPVGGLQRLFLVRGVIPSSFSMRIAFEPLRYKKGRELYRSVGQVIYKHLLVQRIMGYRIGSFIPWAVMICLCRNFRDILGKNNAKEKIKDKHLVDYDGKWVSSDSYIPGKVPDPDSIWLGQMFSPREAEELTNNLSSLARRASQITWITREIDKITAMGYFIIIVSLFISAEILLTGFLDKFLVTFQGSAQARTIILAFSIITLIAVSLMLLRRLNELQSKAWITFLFLVVIESIKIEKTTFDKSLQEIEQYLTNGDWAMASYWIYRVMDEYDDVVKRELIARKKTSVEDIKDVEKNINYQDLGIY